MRAHILDDVSLLARKDQLPLSYVMTTDQCSRSITCTTTSIIAVCHINHSSLSRKSSIENFHDAAISYVS